MTVSRGPDGWRLEKRVDLATLVTVVTALALVAGLVTGLRARMDLVEERLCAVTRRLDESQATVLKVERIEERLAGMQAVLVEIKEGLRSRGGR